MKIKAIIKISLIVIKSFVKNLGKFILYSFSSLIPKKKNLWIFGCWEGRKFCDNAKYLFLYVTKHHPEIKAVWLTKSKEVFSQLKKQGFEVYYTFSLEGFLISARAKFIFITHGFSADVNPYVAAGAKIIDLFHATLPIKKMGYEHFNTLPLLKRILSIMVDPFEYKKCSYTVSSSENTKLIMSGALGISNKQVLVTGLPRTDYIQGKIPIYNKDKTEMDLLLSTKRYEKLIYFIPTFRNNKDFDLFSFGYDPDYLNDFLKSINGLMVLRFHPFDREKYAQKLIKTNNVVIDYSEDVYPLLKKTDILITDYSSICYDFLLLDRPLIFANFGHQEYLNERKLYYDYEEVTPGLKAENWNQMLAALKAIIDQQGDGLKKKRDEMLDFVYEYKDGQSCRRITEFVKSLN